MLCAVSAASCTFNTDGYHPTGTTGAGGEKGTTSSSKSVSSVSTTVSTSASSTTSNSSSSSTGGGCADESGPPPSPCAMFTDDFTMSPDLNWIYAPPSSVGGGKATAVSNGGSPSAGFVLGATHPAFPMKECWMSFSIDTGDLGDNDRAYVDFVGTYKLHFTFTKTNVIFDAGSSYPTPFRGVFRLREHNGCLHVETAKMGDMQWTSVDGQTSQPWLQTPGHIEFGITMGDGSLHTADFSKFNLPPAPL